MKKVNVEGSKQGLICKYCDTDIGMWWGQLSKHLWLEHEDKMIEMLRSHVTEDTLERI